MTSQRLLADIFLLFALATFAACGGGGGGGGSGSAPSTYMIGGTVSGLAGTGLVLQSNGGDNLTVAANATTFTFSAPILSGANYAVTVLTQPTGPSQTCSVTSGSGTVGGGNVTSVAVSCTTNTYTIGGTVSGLAGSGLVLRNNGGNDLTILANGAFTFSTPILSGTAYAVTVQTQPSNLSQTCTVTSASGTVSAANVTTVVVTCVVSITLPKTGQTLCYDATGAIACASTGQDGELQTGVAASPRFVVGTAAEVDCVTDNLTGLMWVRSPSFTGVNWANALNAANSLTLCGFTDWRLPNRAELDSLSNYGVADNAAALNAAGFSNVVGFYWSSTTRADFLTEAWLVIIASGHLVSTAKSNTYPYVWPVRAGQ